METATIQIKARTRRMRPALLLWRMAVRLRWPRLARWAVGLVRIETQIGHGQWRTAGSLALREEDRDHWVIRADTSGEALS